MESTETRRSLSFFLSWKKGTSTKVGWMYIESESQLPWLLFWRHHICNFVILPVSKFLSFGWMVFFFSLSLVVIYVTELGSGALLRLFDIIGVNAREQQKREREVCVCVSVCMCGDVMNFALGRRSVNEAHVATFCELSLRAHIERLSLFSVFAHVRASRMAKSAAAAATAVASRE